MDLNKEIISLWFRAEWKTFSKEAEQHTYRSMMVQETYLKSNIHSQCKFTTTKTLFSGSVRI